MTDPIQIPLPAAIANAGPFKIMDNKETGLNFCVYPDSEQSGILSVPLGQTPDQFAIRLHEYGHLLLVSSGFHDVTLIQKARKQKIDETWLQAALDVIVNHHLLELGCNEISDLPPALNDLNDDYYSFLDRAYLASVFLSSAGLKSEKDIRSQVVKTGSLTANDIVFLKAVNKKLSHWSQQKQLPFAKFFKLLQTLTKRFGWLPDRRFREGENWGEFGDRKSSIDWPVNLAAADDMNVFEDLDNNQKELCYDLIKTGSLKENKRNLRILAKKMKMDIRDNVWNEWGEMETAYLPLIKPHPTRKNARKFLPGFVGPFRYPHRALIPSSDGAAFAYRQKAKGGTILLDCSGSMKLSIRQIDALLYQAPMLTVVGYTGNGKTGSLAIFIKNGMLASTTAVRSWYQTVGENNTIDGPALRWLIKQRRPRIWISDGEVNGINGTGSENLSLEAALLKKMGHITQFETIAKCLKAFPNKLS